MSVKRVTASLYFSTAFHDDIDDGDDDDDDDDGDDDDD